MSTPTTPKTNNRRKHKSEKDAYKNMLKERASSFHGRTPLEGPESRLRRPNALPELLVGGRSLSFGAYVETKPKLTKLLLNVTVQGSVGAVQVLMSPESTVGDLIAAAIRQYIKEGRRPIISADSSTFDLHYSPFSLESLVREEELDAVGSRNFFLCARKAMVVEETCCSKGTTSFSSSCSNEVEKAVKIAVSPWLRFMDFLL